MHNAALISMGLDDRYRYTLHTLSEDKLPNLVDSMRDGTIFGANITIPHKTKIIQLLDDISKDAEHIGAVNTLYRHKNQISGCNTDAIGFKNAIEESKVSPQGTSIGILGAGGAARSVAYALLEKDIDRLCIFNRSISNAQRISTDFKKQGYQIETGPLPRNKEELDDIDILVNCTPVGMRGHSYGISPLPREVLHNRHIVVDLVYNPLRTRLLRDAEEIGCKTVDGVGMLVHQGAASFKIWIGKDAPVSIMQAAVRHSLERLSD